MVNKIDTGMIPNHNHSTWLMKICSTDNSPSVSFASLSISTPVTQNQIDLDDIQNHVNSHKSKHFFRCSNDNINAAFQTV